MLVLWRASRLHACMQVRLVTLWPCYSFHQCQGASATADPSSAPLWTPASERPPLDARQMHTGGLTADVMRGSDLALRREAVRRSDASIAGSALSCARTQCFLHRYLRRAGTPVLLLSYADLLWRTQYTTDRLLRFLPCAASLNASYTVQLGRDYFDFTTHTRSGGSNRWKARGTVADFGASHPPESVGYSLVERRCDGTPPFAPSWVADDADLVRRFNASRDYLREWSDLDWEEDGSSGLLRDNDFDAWARSWERAMEGV